MQDQTWLDSADEAEIDRRLDALAEREGVSRFAAVYLDALAAAVRRDWRASRSSLPQPVRQ